MLYNREARLRACLILTVLFVIFSHSALIYNGSITGEFTEIQEFDGQFLTGEKLVAITDDEGPMIGIPSLNGTPGSDESTSLTCAINDPDGVRNASLFWQYESINETLFNTTMSGTQVEFVYETEFQETGFITDTGLKIDTITGWMYGEYTYEVASDEVISEIDTVIRATGPPGNLLVHILIDFKNHSTSEWQNVINIGGIGSSEDLGDIHFTDTNVTAGYKIFAITYSDDKEPAFEYLRMYREEYTAIIPAPDQPTFVTHYVTAFDDLNNSATSENGTYLADWAPEAIINDVPEVIRINQNFILNVTVFDEDGANTINKSSVIALYQLESEIDWNSVQLTHIADTSATEAFFNGSIPMTGLHDQESNLFVMINVSDSVGGIKGLEGSSPTETIIIDSLAPRVIDTNVIGDVVITDPEFGTVTLISSIINITAEFTDPTGIETVNIYYSLPNGTAPVMLPMTNITPIGIEFNQSTFIVTLPATNETAFVEYYFESVDYFGNTGNTADNFYYADGSAPVIDCLTVFPTMISNSTPSTILFNTTDYSSSRQSIIWYSFDGSISWSSILAYPIDYSAQIDYLEVFEVDDLPLAITDSSTSYFPIEVTRKGRIDSAVLTVELSHDLSTDLRIWLMEGDENRFLLFDRESGSINLNLTIDLLDLGFNQSDFDHGNFIIVIEDFSDLYSGIITTCQITLKHYALPLGYQFMATIPFSSNDTTVYYYITLTDLVWNVENSSTFSYYSDGLPPSIDVQEISSPLNLEGSNSIQINTNVTDLTGMYEVEIYYRFSELDQWNIDSMSLDPSTALYTYDIPVTASGGTLTYRIRAYDLAGHLSESISYEIEFTSGLAPTVELLDTPYSSPLDMQEIATIRIIANASDVDGTVIQVELNYKFANGDNWIVVNMIWDQQMNYYFYDVDLPTSNGTLILKITARDDLGLESETSDYSISFINAFVEPDPQPDPSMGGLFGALATSGLSIAGLSSILGAAGYLIRKKVLERKLKISEQE